MGDFPEGLKHWRHHRRLSQLQLSVESGVSPRHLAFLETGRARPSRGMVLRLAEVLGLPRGEANALLGAAGFVGQFPVLPLGAAEMARVRQAMDWTISRHAPYPAMILDRLWRIVAMNRPAEHLFGPAGLVPGVSLLVVAENLTLFAALVENWAEVGHHTLQRLRAESAKAGGVAELDRVIAVLAAEPKIAGFQPQGEGRVVVPTIYRMGETRLALFSTYAQFGSAEEVALAEMKIELMFPADAQAEALLRRLAP